MVFCSIIFFKIHVSVSEFHCSSLISSLLFHPSLETTVSDTVNAPSLFVFVFLRCLFFIFRMSHIVLLFFLFLYLSLI
jgi:hypothetical protein